jgi:hypothetical protein
MRPFTLVASTLVTLSLFHMLKCIEKIDPRLHGFLHNGKRIGFIRCPAEVHRSEA